MKSSTAKTNFISKTSKVVVFALFFMLVLGAVLTSVLYTDVHNTVGSSVADATAGKYYTFNGNKIVISASALDGATFTLDETWNTSTYTNYWTYNCVNQNYLTYKPQFADSKGAGIEANSDEVRQGYNTYSGYAYLTLAPEEGLTITKITVTAGYLYARSDGDIGASTADHYTKATLSIIAGSASAEVATTQASEYGNRNGESNTSGSNSLSTNIDSNGNIQIRLTGTYYKEEGSIFNNKVLHRVQTHSLSVAIEGTYSLPGDGTDANPYKLRNRSDFDFLSAAIAVNNSTFISAKYSVEPNTANSQTAYASGGREIKMLSTEFTPIGNSTYQFKGSIIFD